MRMQMVAGLAALAVAGVVCAADVVMPGNGTAPGPVAGYPVGWCIRGQAEVAQQAKEIGYEFVELNMGDILKLDDAGFEKLKEGVQATGLPVVSGYAGIPKEVVLVGPNVDGAKADTQVAKVLSRLEALKSRYVIFNAGASWKVPEGFDRAKAWEQLVAFSKKFASEAGKRGMTVLVEPVRSSDSNMLTTVAEASKLVDDVADEHFGILVDFSFFTMQKDDLGELKKAGAKVKHVWVSNPAANRTYAMDDSGGDYAGFFGVLKEVGYKGALAVHGGPVTKNDPEKKIEGVRVDGPKAIAFLRMKAIELAK